MCCTPFTKSPKPTASAPHTLLPPCAVQQASHLRLCPGQALQQQVAHRLGCCWCRHREPVPGSHALLHQ